MRFFITFIFFFGILIPLSAQTITGQIRDLASKKPLLGVKVESAENNTVTDTQGKFSIQVYGRDDSLTFSLIGYKTQRLIYKNGIYRSNIQIALEDIVTEIEEIVIERKVAGSDQPKVKPIFIEQKKKSKLRQIFGDRVDLSGAPRPGFLANGSTAQLFSINVLSVISMFKKDKEPKKSKEEQLEELERDIQNADFVFSKKLITEITGLTGDRLQIFQNIYRRPYSALIEMSEYELRVYIEKSFKEFQKENPTAKKP